MTYILGKCAKVGRLVDLFKEGEGKCDMRFSKAGPNNIIINVNNIIIRG